MVMPLPLLRVAVVVVRDDADDAQAAEAQGRCAGGGRAGACGEEEEHEAWRRYWRARETATESSERRAASIVRVH